MTAWDSLVTQGTRWIDSKRALELLFDLSPDAMHIHGSFLLLFVIAAVLRRRPDNIWPWLMLLVIELVNEANDVFRPSMPTMRENWYVAGHDVLNTMFWPTVLLIFGRWLFPPASPVAQAGAESVTADRKPGASISE